VFDTKADHGHPDQKKMKYWPVVASVSRASSCTIEVTSAGRSGVKAATHQNGGGR
jgi:hypothetical protein